MRSLNTIIPALALLLLFGTAEAKQKGDDASSKTYAINTYVDAMARGRLNGLNDVLDQSAQFSLLQGKRIVSYNKKQMLDFLQTVKNIAQDCTTSTSVVESNAYVNVIKVDMQFNGFTRSNYVTLANNGSGWKIINVYSVFN
jgi:hypothetical protein